MLIEFCSIKLCFPLYKTLKICPFLFNDQAKTSFSNCPSSHTFTASAHPRASPTSGKLRTYLAESHSIWMAREVNPCWETSLSMAQSLHNWNSRGSVYRRPKNCGECGGFEHWKTRLHSSSRLQQTHQPRAYTERATSQSVQYRDLS